MAYQIGLFEPPACGRRARRRLLSYAEEKPILDSSLQARAQRTGGPGTPVYVVVSPKASGTTSSPLVWTRRGRSSANGASDLLSSVFRASRRNPGADDPPSFPSSVVVQLNLMLSPANFSPLIRDVMSQESWARGDGIALRGAATERVTFALSHPDKHQRSRAYPIPPPGHSHGMTR